MTAPKSPRFDTLSLHAGQRPDPATGSRAVPIYQTTSYVFDDTEHAAALFNLERAGHIYSRISNPTVAVLEERISALEGGVGAVATASGQAALHLAIATLMGAGGHIVASARIYGGSHNMFTHTLPRFGITTTLADPRDPDSFAHAITDKTRLLFAETLGNPGLEVLDIKAVSDVAHKAGVPLLIDSTFATPYLCRPFEHGADLIMHSATKFLGGHGIAIGGILVDSGRFDWAASGKFPTMTEPYAGYHGISFAEEFGPAAFIMRARAEGLRDFGACMSPANAFYLLQGIETLPVRMGRHVANAETVARFLEKNPAVAWVKYPGLESHPDSCARQTPAAERGRRHPELRHQGRTEGRRQADRAAARVLASRQRRRRQVAGHPSGQHHASADERRGVGQGGRRRGTGAPLRRPRRRTGPDRRPRPGARRLAEGLISMQLKVDGRAGVCGNGRAHLRCGQAGDRVPARRRHGPHGLAAAGALVRLARILRAGARPAGAWPLGRAGAFLGRRDGGMGRAIARYGRRARSGPGGPLHGWRHRAWSRRGIGRAHHPRGVARHGRRHPRTSRFAHRRPRAARCGLPHDDGLVVRRTRQDGRQSRAWPVDDRRRHGPVCAQRGRACWPPISMPATPGRRAPRPQAKCAARRSYCSAPTTS